LAASGQQSCTQPDCSCVTALYPAVHHAHTSSICKNMQDSATTLLGFSTALRLVDNGAQLCTVLTNKLGLARLLPWLDVQLLFTPSLHLQIRESMYQSLGLMSTSVAAFYACGAGQGLWGPGLMDHVEYMDHQHLRMLLRHLMLSFTRICPPQHRSALTPCCCAPYCSCQHHQLKWCKRCAE